MDYHLVFVNARKNKIEIFSKDEYVRFGPWEQEKLKSYIKGKKLIYISDIKPMSENQLKNLANTIFKDADKMTRFITLINCASMKIPLENNETLHIESQYDAIEVTEKIEKHMGKYGIITKLIKKNRLKIIDENEREELEEQKEIALREKEKIKQIRKRKGHSVKQTGGLKFEAEEEDWTNSIGHDDGREDFTIADTKSVSELAGIDINSFTKG